MRILIGFLLSVAVMLAGIEMVGGSAGSAPTVTATIQKKKPRKARRKTPRRRVFRRPKPPLSPEERQQLLRSFSNAAINQELDHRLLTLFTLEELQAEAARRGIR